ncbi:hypothetical protein ABZ705_04605 [Streptomyces sp. NPDC006984]|uniref:hypothetical protein n=1 Tax=unclassified Streptomyces TaxID=2593676 RepID=UPI001F206451|nr:hypothetical protein [Streptomyces sp. CC210A]
MIAGRGPAPSLVLALVQRLPDTSMTVALASGGREFLGWGVDRHMTADLFDALNANTKATGNWGKGKVPKIPAYPRPKAKSTTPSTTPKKPASVAAIYARLSGR